MPTPSTDVQRAASDVTVQIVGRFANLVLGMFVTVVVVRSLGDEGFGEWSGVLAVVGLTGALCDLGLTQVAVKRATEDTAGEAAWLGALVQLRLVLSIPAFLVSIGVIALISANRTMFVVGAVLSLTLLLSALTALSAIFQLRVRNDLRMLVLTLQSVVWAIAVLIVFNRGAGPVALALGFLAAAVISALAQLALTTRHGRITFRGARSRWGEMTRVGVPIAIGSVLILGYGRVDQILVLVLSNATEAGLYSSVYRIFDQAQFVAVSVMTTVFPLLTASFAADTARFRQILQATVELMITVSAGGFAFTLAYSKSFVILLFGHDFAAAADALPILVGTLGVVSLGYVVGNLVILTERQRTFVVIALGGLVFNVVLNVALIPRYGFVAAAWVTLATEIFVLSLSWLAVRSRLPARPSLGRIPRVLAAATALLGILVLCRALSVDVGVGIAVTAIAYPLLLLAARAVSPAELRLVRGAANG
jgi:O-antigen/teichoic acid export membrane protein